MLRPVSLNLGLWAADLERIMALSCQQDKCTQATEVNIAQQAERALCHGSSVPAERGRQENLSWEAGGGGVRGTWGRRMGRGRSAPPWMRRVGEKCSYT